MQFRSVAATVISHYAALCRRLATATFPSTKPCKLPPLSKVHCGYKHRRIQEAQKVLTDYLHSTRLLPFTHAEQISKNATFHLYDLITKVDYSTSDFSRLLKKFLRYHPVNELAFFFESIGINPDEIHRFLPSKKFFLSEDSTVLKASSALVAFGFPWNRLGELYKEDISIFQNHPDELNQKLRGLKECGFSSRTVVGICLVFPHVLSRNPELAREAIALIDDFKKLVAQFDLLSSTSADADVDTWAAVFRKVKVFYDLGCRKGEMGELLCRNKNIFLECPEDVLVKKVDFFCRLSVNKNAIGLMLLDKPEILNYDLEGRVISVLEILEHFGMSKQDLDAIARNYPLVLGRNKMVNLPHVMRALDLQEWFFDKMRHGDHRLLESYRLGNEELDNDYKRSLDEINSRPTPAHTIRKLDFLHSIGCGENHFTIKILAKMYGYSITDLPGRFDALLRTGIPFSKICKMLTVSPKILNQNSTVTETKLLKLPTLSKVACKKRPGLIQEAQKILTNYLHSPELLPISYAEHISKNATFHLHNLITKVDYCSPDFSKMLKKLLRHHPINEHEFFYESIGMNTDEIRRFLPSNKFFLSEDPAALKVSCTLAEFGFPWNRLGELYKEDISISRRDIDSLNQNLIELKDHGFCSGAVVGICLIFPHVLSGNPEFSKEVSALFDDLKKLVIQFDLFSSTTADVDTWVAVFRKVKVFYDLGCEEGKMGELMGKSKNIFLKCSYEVLVNKVNFFRRLSVNKNDIGLMLLEKPEILNFDLEGRVISVLELLEHFSMSKQDLDSVAQNYPLVLGRNKMVNLPHVMRALDLQEWFFDKMRHGDHHLLQSYTLRNQDLDNHYKRGLDEIRSAKTPVHTFKKLDFLHSIGCGENYLTIKILANVHGTGTELHERFDCLLRNGIGFSKLWKMLTVSPKILNQNSRILEQKMNFLKKDMGSSLDFLDVFPSYFCYDLDKRIKPRYHFHMWLMSKGWIEKSFSIASMIATSEKYFLARVAKIHPSASKHWFKYFAVQSGSKDSKT